MAASVSGLLQAGREDAAGSRAATSPVRPEGAAVPYSDDEAVGATGLRLAMTQGLQDPSIPTGYLVLIGLYGVLLVITLLMKEVVPMGEKLKAIYAKVVALRGHLGLELVLTTATTVLQA